MNELDDLLKTLRSEHPTPSDLERWKTAVRQIRARRVSRWVELVAAMLVGILIGGTMFNKTPDEENSASHATIERVITKIE